MTKPIRILSAMKTNWLHFPFIDGFVRISLPFPIHNFSFIYFGFCMKRYFLLKSLVAAQFRVCFRFSLHLVNYFSRWLWIHFGYFLLSFWNVFFSIRFCATLSNRFICKWIHHNTNISQNSTLISIRCPFFCFLSFSSSCSASKWKCSFWIDDFLDVSRCQLVFKSSRDLFIDPHSPVLKCIEVLFF